MRTLVLLFNCYLLLLALLPGFTTAGPEAGSASSARHCCRKAADAPAQLPGEKSRDYPPRNCTPLFGCTKIQAELPQIEGPALIESPGTVIYSDFLPSFTSAFLSDTWHPPRV